MDNDLAAIKDAWESRPAAGGASADPSTKAGDSSVYEMADAYVEAHPEDFTGMDQLPLEVIVSALEKARSDGDEAQEWKFQTWLFHHYEPQNIGGTHTATIRVTNGQ